MYMYLQPLCNSTIMCTFFLYISMLQYTCMLYVNATIQCMTYSHTCSHALMNVGQIARNMNDIERRCRFTVALVYQ